MYYNTYVDGKDDANGHGTHVAGSALGASLSSDSNAEYNGMMSEAKLAFFDIGNSTSEELSVPSSLSSQMFYPMYQAGARIFR